MFVYKQCTDCDNRKKNSCKLFGDIIAHDMPAPTLNRCMDYSNFAKESRKVQAIHND